jgi:hypothetical protein
MEIIKIRLRLTPQRSQHNLKNLKRCLLNGKPVWQTLILSRTPLLIKMPLSTSPLSNNSRFEMNRALNSPRLPHYLRQLDFQTTRKFPALNDLLKCSLLPIFKDLITIYIYNRNFLCPYVYVKGIKANWTFSKKGFKYVKEEAEYNS